MSVSSEDVKKVAHLARIKICDSEVDNLRKTLNDILNFVAQLEEVDCSNIDGTAQYGATLHEREDIAIPTDQSVMLNATAKEHNMFVVPKVVE